MFTMVTIVYRTVFFGYPGLSWFIELFSVVNRVTIVYRTVFFGYPGLNCFQWLITRVTGFIKLSQCLPVLLLIVELFSLVSLDYHRCL